MARVKRGDLQALARVRANEARILLENKSFAGAYHLIGLAVECALKACIARQTDQFEFPDLDRARESWQHRPAKLLSVAGLQEELAKKARTDPDFEANWLTVKDWDADSRYQEWDEKAARDLFLAITDAHHGVLPWVEGHW